MPSDEEQGFVPVKGWTQAEIDSAADVAWDTLTTDLQRFMGHWGYRHFARALILALGVDSSELHRAVGWVRRDGSWHKGCPPLQEPHGWLPLLIPKTESKA